MSVHSWTLGSLRQVPNEASRVLVVTPDFPPATGGIQLLMARVAEGLRTFVPTVITRASPAPVRETLHVRRTRSRAGRLSLLELNAITVAEALRRPPAVILCGHLTCMPAAWAARARSG